MKKINVGILGATGAVGQEMLKVMAERHFPVAELRLFGSERSAGKKVVYEGQEVTIEATTVERFDGLDLLLGAVDNDLAKIYIPEAVKRGVHVVDNSSAFRLDPEVPLVVPEVNPEDIAKSKGLIANPNCATIIALVAVAPLHKEAHIKRMVLSTYQAVSGAGAAGITALEEEVKRADGERVEGSVFPYPIAYNLIPQIGGFNDMGYTSEEMKLQNEGRKILHDDALRVSCTCVRVPIQRSHSESITLEFDDALSLEKAKALLEKAPGVKYWDDPEAKHYPMPMLTSNQDLVYVGRLRRDLSALPEEMDKSMVLFCCADQVRKGAATNAVQIAEILFKTR